MTFSPKHFAENLFSSQKFSENIKFDSPVLGFQVEHTGPFLRLAALNDALVIFQYFEYFRMKCFACFPHSTKDWSMSEH
jgi:hypothetical protein